MGPRIVPERYGVASMIGFIEAVLLASFVVWVGNIIDSFQK
jgi:hypothetical protein